MTVSACPKKSYLHVQKGACLILQGCYVCVAVSGDSVLPLDEAIKTTSENCGIVLEARVQERSLMRVAAFQGVLSRIVQPGELQTA